MRFGFEHGQHAVGHHKSANDIDRGEDDCNQPEHSGGGTAILAGAAGAGSVTINTTGGAQAYDSAVTLGAELLSSSADDFGAYIKSETAKWGKVIRDSGARAD